MLLQKELDQLEKMISGANAINTKVSAKGVDWHIDHSLKVVNGICGTLRKSDPSVYKWKFSFPRLVIFTLGSIPRGKGRSPKSVLPPESIGAEDLRAQLELARIALQELNRLPGKSNFIHPFFGALNLKQSKKFIRMHTVHHLKIIDDIINQ